MCFVGLIKLRKHGIYGTTLVKGGDDVDLMWMSEKRKKHKVKAKVSVP